MLSKSQIEKITESAESNGRQFARENPGLEVKRNECGSWTDALLAECSWTDLACEYGVDVNKDGEWDMEDWSRFLTIYENACHSAWKKEFDAITGQGQ